MRNVPIRYILLILACALLASCGRKRITKTITVYDTVIVEASHKDTVVSLQKFIHSTDTIYMHKDRLTVQVWHEGDDMKMSGDCAGDTIYKRIEVPVECKEPTRWQALQRIQEPLMWFTLIMLISGFILGLWLKR